MITILTIITITITYGATVRAKDMASFFDNSISINVKHTTTT